MKGDKCRWWRHYWGPWRKLTLTGMLEGEDGQPPTEIKLEYAYYRFCSCCNSAQRKGAR